MSYSYLEYKELFNKINIINSINFTTREIDVMSCLLHNRGEKKIASILNISPRTVSSHVHNIMLKMNYSSREQIIDLIEKSGKINLFKEYYNNLLIRNIFYEYLSKVSKLANNFEVKINYDPSELNLDEKAILEQIVIDLVSAGVKISNNSGYVFSVISADNNISNLHLNDYLITFKDVNNDKINQQNIVNFSNEYVINIFKIIGLITKNNETKILVEEFEKKISSIRNSGFSNNPLEKNSLVENKTNHYYFFIYFFSLLSIAIIITLIYDKFYFLKNQQSIISANLPLPCNHILLNRNIIMHEIEKKMLVKDPIKIAVLLGVGGAGKTTLARQYARSQKSSLIWEINAENSATIISSLHKLLYSLCDDEEDKRELVALQKENEADRQDKLLVLLTKKIKKYPNWLIIYDNLTCFHDIQKFFPYDANLWGKGKVIITTSNYNIGQNIYINDNNIIYIQDLRSKEKLELFTGIVGKNNISSPKQKQNLEKFLEKLPSFPLDVSVAAYYIKEERMSYEKYLENIFNQEKNFISIQKNILKDIGEYTKTRYDIASLSIKTIIDSNPNFKDLMSFICKINSQDIPKELLIMYKDELIVNDFIRHLKKFSLITKENFDNDKYVNLFSIHRSIKAIIADYLENYYKLSNSNDIINMAKAIDSYAAIHLKNHNVININHIILHIENFLDQSSNLSSIKKADLKKKLGMCYFYLASYKHAGELFQQVVVEYRKHYGENNINTALVLARLGSVFRNIGEYKKSKEMLEHSIEILHKTNVPVIEMAWVSVYLGSVYRNLGDYKLSEKKLLDGLKIFLERYGDQNIQVAWTYSYLGSLYMNIGKYQKARDYLEKSSKIYQSIYGSDHTKTAWISVRLATLYKKLGYYDKAEEILESALKVYKKYIGEDSPDVAWALCHLGRVYRKSGRIKEYNKAIEQSYKIYSKYFKDDHINLAWVTLHLANSYSDVGEHTKGLDLIERSFKVYTQYYGKDHVKIAKLFKDKGIMLINSDKFEQAENCLKYSVAILSKNNHPDLYHTFETISDLYAKKLTVTKDASNKFNMQKKSASYIIEAITIANKYLPSDSQQTKRLREKLSILDKNALFYHSDD